MILFAQRATNPIPSDPEPIEQVPFRKDDDPLKRQNR